MVSCHKKLLKHFCISLFVLLNSCLAVANTQEQPISDMRILIDVSGSMKQNDPNNLRAPALKLLVGLLPNNSRAGVWTFGKEVNMQVKLDNVSDAWKKYARNEATKIHSLGLFTDIEDAIRRATWDWKDPDPKYQRTLILLTDGVVDISRDPDLNEASRQRIISHLLPKLNNADVKVNTIALSENADHKLLQKLATRTNGWYTSVSSADELKRKFLHLFEKSTQADAIPLKDNSFTVDKSVSEMTVLIFKTDDSMPTELVTPDGTILTNNNKSEEVQWHQESGYDMITISEPAAGQWKAKAEIDPDNRVLVVTNLKLRSNKFTHNFLKGDIITIYTDLEEENKIIKKQGFLKLVTFNLKINGTNNAYKLNDNGSIPDAKPQDGIFSSIIETAGLEESNDLLIEAKGATFERQLRHSFKVFKSPFTIDIKEPVNGQPFDFNVTIKPTIFVKSSVSLSIELPDGKTLEPKPAVNQRWETSIPAIYQGNNIQVILTGNRYNQSGPYQYSESYSLPSIVKEDVVVVEPEPEEVMEPPVILEKEATVKEEPTLPKEAEPPPPPVTVEKNDEKKVLPEKKEEPPPEKAEPIPEPEHNANWFAVFIIVLVGNVILIAGIYFGYQFWNKRRNAALSDDNAAFNEDSTEAVTDEQIQSTEAGLEDGSQVTSTDEASVENDVIANEPEADAKQDNDAGQIVSDEDSDILMQQLGVEGESEETPASESLDETNNIAAEMPEETIELDSQQGKDSGSLLSVEENDVLMQQLGVEDEPEETPASESLDEANNIAAEIPEETIELDSQQGKDAEPLFSVEESDILMQQLGIGESDDIPGTESIDGIEDSTAETTSEVQEPSANEVSEASDETIELESIAENTDSESDIEIENGSDKLQDMPGEEAILSDLDFEFDKMDEDELKDSKTNEPAKDAKQ